MSLVNQEDEMKRLLINELVSGELRAQRSLRILKHQEKRLAGLENTVSAQSVELKGLKEDHISLLEVHDHQVELQDLQRDLIKLQEIEYLTKFTGDKKCPTESKTVGIQTPERKASEEEQEVQVQPSIEPKPKEKIPDLPYLPKTKRGKSLPSRGSGTVIEYPLSEDSPASSVTERDDMNQTKTLNSYKNRSIRKKGEKAEDAKYFNMLQKSLESLDGFLKEKPSTEEKRRTSRRSKSHGASKPGHYEIPDEDIAENILILRERLSSHRMSIDNLSDEIVDLRHERIELLTYLQNLLDWKQKVEFSLKNGTTPLDPKPSFQEENLQAGAPVNPKAEKKHVSILNRYEKMTKRMDESGDSNIANPKHVCIFSKYLDMSKPMDKSENESLQQNTKLGERANRMWDLACKFFTPSQAHFILTAPMPNDEESSDED